MQIAQKVGCWRTDEDQMLACLKMSDPVGLTMAGKIDVLLLLGKGQNRNDKVQEFFNVKVDVAATDQRRQQNASIEDDQCHSLNQ